MDKNKIEAAFKSFLDDKVSKLNNKHKIIICIGVVLVPVIIFYFFWYSKNITKIAGLDNDISRLQHEITKAKADAAKFAVHQAERLEIKKKFEAAKILIPKSKEIPSLLTIISGNAKNAGLDFATFVPKGQRALEFYAEIPFSISGKGTYHNIGFFLDSVSKLPRIVNVTNLTLGGPSEVEGEIILSTKVDLVTYKFLETENVGQ